MCQLGHWHKEQGTSSLFCRGNTTLIPVKHQYPLFLFPPQHQSICASDFLQDQKGILFIHLIRGKAGCSLWKISLDVCVTHSPLLKCHDWVEISYNWCWPLCCYFDKIIKIVSKGQKSGKLRSSISSWLGGDFFKNCLIKGRKKELCPKNHWHDVGRYFRFRWKQVTSVLFRSQFANSQSTQALGEVSHTVPEKLNSRRIGSWVTISF